MKTHTSIQNFLDQVIHWAMGQANIQAVALVGSYARNAAKESSDIDLVILVDEPEKYLQNTAWAGQFGLVGRQQVEDYGRLTSLRIWYLDGPEVEFGLTKPDWAAQPLDESTRRVIMDGIRVLYERKPLLSLVLEGLSQAYDLYFQVSRTGRTQAHVPAWPGCNWFANSPEEALEQAPAAIAWHLAWLRKYGKPAPSPDEPIIPRLVQQRPSSGCEGNLTGFFECERQPVSAEEGPVFLDLMACARVELLELTRDLPEEVLNKQPAPGSWSIQEVLRHVAASERWYLTRILDPATVQQFRPNRSVWQRLEAVRLLAMQRLAGLSEAERSRIISDKSGELWSARKVFRRFLEHEREHTHHILEILAHHAENS